jgi:SEC-C motif-containing protein
MSCQCNSGLDYGQCCGPYHNYERYPVSAESLMRSRYCAYTLKLADYILDTYSQREQEKHTVEDILAFASSCQFVRLEIVSTPSEYEVEFKAFYIYDSKAGVLHEQSLFEKEQDRWKYLNGKLFEHPEVKLSRNDPCPCQSGKKFKQCHQR